MTSLENINPLILWCLSTTLIAAALIFANSSEKPQRKVEKDVLGNVKFITSVSDIRHCNDFWNRKGIPKKAGLVIGSSQKGYIYDSSVPHWATVGKTGSRKTWLMTLQTLHVCMAAGFNLIVTGKDELLELTGNKALEQGYKHVIFDLKGYPRASGFNPLELIVEYIEENNIAEAQRTARQTAADLIPLGGENNTYFPKAARSALTACLLIVAMANIPREQKNMASVCALINEGTTAEGSDPSAPLKDYIRSSEVGSSHPAYAPATDFLSDGDITTAGKNVLSLRLKKLLLSLIMNQLKTLPLEVI